MLHDFDLGLGTGPFAALMSDYPGTDVYSSDDFRTEWGPILYRGRLDGTARVLILGQDPATHEAICRRILVGEAGHRTQGLLGKLGIERSYLLVNTFVYSVYGQQGGEKHIGDQHVADYRNRWLQTAFANNPIEAVIALGHLADVAWLAWQADPTPPAKPNVAYAHITHPTTPESSSHGARQKLVDATRDMLANWNANAGPLSAAIKHPDHDIDFVPYGEAFRDGERLTIPEGDMPAGLPDWMRAPQAWATRTGDSAAVKRRTITVKIPTGLS